MSKDMLLEASKLHISDVRQGMIWFADKLLHDSINHDHTKISMIDDFYDSFSRGLTGDEFKTEKWYQAHLNERHHLKDKCPEDVNLIDVIEQIVDIVVAGMARTGKVFDDDLNETVLMKAYHNTVKLFKEQVEVVE